ncbi:inner membrane CreD family protein, partial [uncultured Ruegeria sp.]|uniref:inner membrane CreD family protein n=1 Tax=uncultured Ruegeria sp. TaxID=259304 RepID=UPI0026336AF2
MKSIGFRFLIVGVLTVLMFIPVFLAGEVINSRAHYNRSTVNSLSGEWGGQQLLSGPQIAIPVEGPVTRIEKRDVVAIVNDKEVIRQKDFEVTEVQRKDSVYAYPEDFDLNLTTTSEERARGIFKVPVFVA